PSSMSADSFSPPSRSLTAASPGGNLPITGSSNQVFIERSLHISYFRVCLISITIACSRLRRSPDFLYFVENARSAFSTKYNTLFARRSRASTRRGEGFLEVILKLPPRKAHLH